MSESLLGRARNNGLIDLRIHQLRDWAKQDRHRTVDDRPYGGGPGMVIQAEPIYQAFESIRASGAKRFGKKASPWRIYLSPQGKVLTQAKAEALSRKPWVALLCGHYEGIDERAQSLIDEEVSIGDFVLTGGELPAMLLAEAMIRLVPGVVKESDSIHQDSFQQGLLDHPHYTRPADWRGKKVPPVLLSGDHQKVAEWRHQQAVAATRKKRPDLLKVSSRRTS